MHRALSCKQQRGPKNKKKENIMTILHYSRFAAVFAAVSGLVLTACGEPPANSPPVDCPVIGNKCADGSINAGVSPDTGATLYVTPRDAPTVMNWMAAFEYAASLKAYGNDDWRLPTKDELIVLYQNRKEGALKGTFNESGSVVAHWYWSCTERPGNSSDVHTVRITDAHAAWFGKDYLELSTRPVRSEPRP